jgi:nitrogen fixation NifU-like protein
MATELIQGRTVEEARGFSNQEVVAALGGLPPAKIQCSLLAAQALYAALEDYERRSREAKPLAREHKSAVAPRP